jgi:hypothetical protein
MRELIGTPIEIIVNPYTVAFKVGEGTDDEFVASEFAKFVEVAYCVYVEETGEAFDTEPITYSMN